mgnify:CR=1 FL=1
MQDSPKDSLGRIQRKEKMTLAQLKTDPRIDSVWDETGSDDGYWVNLKIGYADLKFDPGQPTHTIHEWDLKSIRARLKYVGRCKCKDCICVS